jgi:hypothetical protein
MNPSWRDARLPGNARVATADTQNHTTQTYVNPHATPDDDMPFFQPEGDRLTIDLTGIEALSLRRWLAHIGDGKVRHVRWPDANRPTGVRA